MNLFDNIIENDFKILLADIGKDILINGTTAKAIINNKQISTSNDFEDDKIILTNTLVKRGDIINYNNNNYIVWSQINDFRYGTYYKCKIRKCNYKLNIAIAKDNQQQVQQYDAFISSKLFDDTVGEPVPLSTDQKVIYLTADNFDKQLKKQDRIIAYGRAWSIKGIDNTLETILMLLVEETTISDKDNVIEEIPDYFTYNNVAITNTTPISIDVGATVQLNTVTTPAGKIVTYSSSDTSVATVDNNGLVTGVSSGTVTITVTIQDTEVSTSIEVTVNDSVVPAITLTGDKTSMGIYEKLTITPTTTPINEPVTYTFVGNSVGCTMAVTNNICVITSGSGVGIVTVRGTLKNYPTVYADFRFVVQ